MWEHAVQRCHPGTLLTFLHQVSVCVCERERDACCSTMTGGVSYRDEVKVNLMGGICVVESCLCVCACVCCVVCIVLCDAAPLGVSVYHLLSR